MSSVDTCLSRKDLIFPSLVFVERCWVDDGLVNPNLGFVGHHAKLFEPDPDLFQTNEPLF
jgi:hypothetical protein